MTEREEAILAAAEAYARNLFAGDASGHDAAHTLRVARMAARLAEAEGADVFTAKLAALLHDADDRKLSPETWPTKARAASFLRSQGLSEERVRALVTIIGEISFAGTDSVTPSTREGCCVQDADRLDALGALGVARTFAYGGSRGRVMYDPEEPPVLSMDGETYAGHVSTSVNHFYEKLFLLKDAMNTAAGRALAQRREDYMKEFLAEFLREWNGEDR